MQDLPEVAKARAQHLAAFEAVRARDAQLHPPPVSIPAIPVRIGPVAAPAEYFPISQYQFQDGHGQYSYGLVFTIAVPVHRTESCCHFSYVGPLGSKSETKSSDGVTRGGYSYLDANGVMQTVHYIADPVNGFRVAATNLPRAPISRPVAPVAAAPQRTFSGVGLSQTHVPDDEPVAVDRSVPYAGTDLYKHEIYY